MKDIYYIDTQLNNTILGKFILIRTLSKCIKICLGRASNFIDVSVMPVADILSYS